MLTIARYRLLDGIRDAKFLFLSALILLAFIFNGLFYSDKYKIDTDVYEKAEADNLQLVSEVCSSLQDLAAFNRNFLLPPSRTTFISEGGARLLPNAVVLNAFSRFEFRHLSRENYMMPLLIEMDWSFIIGALATLLTVVVSYGTVAGEKRDGTLRQVLANPVSRLKLFAGNYLGLLSVVTVALAAGILANLLTLALAGGLPVIQHSLDTVGWGYLLATICLSAFLMIGLAVSSFTGRPAVALVILLVFWVLAVVAVPGISRLIAEQLQEVPSQQWVDEEQERLGDEIWASYPAWIGQFSGNPFEPQMPERAKASQEISDAQQRIRDQAADAKVAQVELANTLSFISPGGVLSDGLQQLTGGGIRGLRLLREYAERHRNQLHHFVVGRDKLDSESGHLVYPDGRRVEFNTFSRKEGIFRTSGTKNFSLFSMLRRARSDTTTIQKIRASEKNSSIQRRKEP